MKDVQGCLKDTSKTTANYSIALLNKIEQTLHIASRFELFFFDKQVNIHNTIGSISRATSSCNHNAATQATAMVSYQSHFRKLDISFSGKQQRAIRTDQKNYSLLLYHFCLVVPIFNVAESISIFSTTQPWLPQ